MESAIQLRIASQKYAYASLQMHEAVAKKAGLPGTDHKYLGFFLQHNQLTAGELAKLCGLSTGAVTGLIDRFENRGFITRIQDHKDRRKVVVVPDIVKIKALLQPLYQEFQNNMDELMATYTVPESEAILSYLSKMTELMQSHTTNINTSNNGTP